MLVIALFVSVLILLVANLVVHRVKDRPTVPLLMWTGALSLGPCLLTVIMPAVLLQGALVVAAGLVWQRMRRGPWLFLPLSVGVTVVVYGLIAFVESRAAHELRVRFPYESMQTRLPMPRPISHTVASPQAQVSSVQSLDDIERLVQDQSHTWRRHELAVLHENTLALFMSNPGFGVSRMGWPSESNLTRGLRPGNPIAQPASHPRPEWSPGLLATTNGLNQDELDYLHLQSVIDFVNAPGFGFVKDRQHVAGFQSHQFSQVPDPAKSWTVDRLELVGLVLHDQPVAYVSPSLPKMDDLREAPTRDLDGFEAVGLEALLRGDQLFVSLVPPALRMLGAVRNVKQCIDCHGGERGDLLGAFSYTLRSRW
jgi:hypothetical protein